MRVFVKVAVSLLMLFVGVIVVDILAGALWVAMSNLVFLIMTLLLMLWSAAVTLVLIWIWRLPTKWTF